MVIASVSRARTQRQMPPSYSDTLGLASPVSCATTWNTAAGKNEITRLIRARFASLAQSLNGEVFSPPPILWDNELEAALSGVILHLGTGARSVPLPILELVERFALTYVTRMNMHRRLDNMRSQTSVALVPRGGIDAQPPEDQLEFVLPKNRHYEKYQAHMQSFRP
jgi:hypothetical protein